MRKLIILLLCCRVLVSMVGCGGNTTPPPTECPSTTVSEMVIAETPPITAVEPTEKEKALVSAERKEQATVQIVTIPITTKKPIEEIPHSETENTSEENDTFQTIETTSSIALQNTESETTVT